MVFEYSISLWLLGMVYHLADGKLGGHKAVTAQALPMRVPLQGIEVLCSLWSQSHRVSRS